MHDAVERGEDGRPGRHEQVEAEMHGPALGPIGAGLLVPAARVQQTRLVVAADADRGTRLPQAAREEAGEGRHVDRLRHAGQVGAGDAQVEDRDRAVARVRVDHRAQGAGVVGEPADDRVGVGTGREATRVAEGVVGQPLMHTQELLQRRPCGLFAHGHVGVARLDRLLVGRVGHADRQPRQDQGVEYGEVGLGERESRVIAGDDVRGRRQRISHAQRRISHGRGEPADDGRMEHIAEVDEAEAIVVSADPIPDHHVVVVGISVDHPRPQRRQSRLDLFVEQREHALDERSPIRPLNRPDVVADPRGAGQIPFEYPVRRGVGKVV